MVVNLNYPLKRARVNRRVVPLGPRGVVTPTAAVIGDRPTSDPLHEEVTQRRADMFGLDEERVGP